MGDHRYRRLVHAAVFDHVLHFVILAALAGFGDNQDIVVADIFVGNAAFRVPVFHPAACRMTAEQDHLLGIYRFNDDPGDLSQLALLVLRQMFQGSVHGLTVCCTVKLVSLDLLKKQKPLSELCIYSTLGVCNLIILQIFFPF